MVLSSQSLRKIFGGARPMIRSSRDLLGRVQPSSIDIPLGDRCYRVSVSALPGRDKTMTELLTRFGKYDFELRTEGSQLERGMTYILPLSAELSLSEQFRAVFSPKSTTGRNDVFVRVITEHGMMFDQTVSGYVGPLYLEVTPLSFNSFVYPFEPLTQMRVISGVGDRLSNEEIAILHSEYGIVRDKNGDPIDAVIGEDGLYLHLDLGDEGKTAGYESLANPEGGVHLGKKELDTKEEFWRRIQPTTFGDLILHPNSFYLLSTRERIVIPPNVCATMEEYSVSMGEFRSHYAGFFDNGFGGEKGTQGVLEFRSRDLPIRFCDGQRVCRLVFYKTDEVPDTLYGTVGNNYTGSGPKFAKNFKEFSKW